jgi:hypothetical protein
MDQRLQDWLPFLRENRILLKCPGKEERFVIVEESGASVSLARLIPPASEKYELSFDQIAELRSRILTSAYGLSLDGDLNDKSALVAVVASLIDVCYSPSLNALVAIRDEVAARQLFMELVSNWRRSVPEYKPLLLLTVLTAIQTGELTDNRIRYGWVSERFAAESRKRGMSRQAKDVEMPFYRLSTDLFWMVSIRDLSRPPNGRATGSVGKIDYALIREPFWSLIQDPSFREEVRQQLVAMLPESNKNEPSVRFFLEKTLVKGRSDREGGPYALGKALWSPQSGEKGARIYELMTELRSGDIVFHLIDNREICGYSTVDSSVDRNFVGLQNTPWADRPGYLVKLRAFTLLEPSIEREWILKNGLYEAELMKLLEEGYRVFYNKSLELNQGAYLTEVPPQLLEVIARAYETHTGKTFPIDTHAQTINGIGSMLENFVKATAEAGLVVDQHVFHRFAASLMAKRLLILTGLSGSGKTKMAQAFARYLTPVDSPAVQVIPVGADWTSNENVIGYPDGLDPTNYIVQPVLDLIIYAHEMPNKPCFLILDEMNLSHVERYFADFLSAMESEEPVPLYSGSERKASGRIIPREIRIPKNLFVIGTVNIDETTYMFSPKVLDRAGVIEFRVTPGDIEKVLEYKQVLDLEKIVGIGQNFAAAFASGKQNLRPCPRPVLVGRPTDLRLLDRGPAESA